MFSVVSKVKRTWSEINKARKSLRVLVKETGGIGKTCQRLQVMNKRWNGFFGQDAIAGVIPPKRAASKSRINTSPAFSAGRVSLLKPSYAFALE